MRQKQEGHGLAKIWCYINDEETMEGAHDSLVDAQAK